MKSQSRVEQYVYIGRSPHGECGLKFRRELKTKAVAGRSPHGECGLKFTSTSPSSLKYGRSPHGECGLKFLFPMIILKIWWSLPAWGVWIEISKYDLYFSEHDVAPRMGSVD